MGQEITIALIGITSALIGTIVGGAVSYFSNKSIKSMAWERSIRREEIHERKKLYSGFLREISRLEMKSINEKTDDLAEFNEVANFIAQIELVSNENILEIAGKLADHALSVHAANEKINKGSYPDLRTQFVSEVRAEMDTLMGT